jgi:hypothetical protein
MPIKKWSLSQGGVFSFVAENPYGEMVAASLRCNGVIPADFVDKLAEEAVLILNGQQKPANAKESVFVPPSRALVRFRHTMVTPNDFMPATITVTGSGKWHVVWDRNYPNSRMKMDSILPPDSYEWKPIQESPLPPTVWRKSDGTAWDWCPPAYGYFLRGSGIQCHTPSHIINSGEFSTSPHGLPEKKDWVAAAVEEITETIRVKPDDHVTRPNAYVFSHHLLSAIIRKHAPKS